ncbi:hypothetical protein LJR231_002058 [Phyllobacterium sp. LjRoot231]|uniref:hypothetical protein n=1 Tax=Phyllobacterium sp. LjRoot231 TaxID=3342289 RepID=UPI003ECCF97C
MSKQQKIEVMVQWFHENYEDPAVQTPHESAEGGYQWIWGGPYDADEVIQEEFSEVADYETMQRAVAEVTREGLFDWAPVHHNNPPPEDEDFRDFLTDEQGNALTDENGNRIVLGRQERDFRAEMLGRLDELESVVNNYEQARPHRGHNNPPELIEDDPLTQPQIQQIIEAVVQLRAEAVKGEPDPLNITAQASILSSIARAVGNWIAQKANVATDALVEAGVVAGVVWAYNHPNEIQHALNQAASSANAWAHQLGVIW